MITLSDTPDIEEYTHSIGTSVTDEHDETEPEPAPNQDGHHSYSDDQVYEHFTQKGLHFPHLNARSLPPIISDVRYLARCSRAALIGITETWLDSSIMDSEITIEGYNICRLDRNRSGGGVCLYIKN